MNPSNPYIRTLDDLQKAIQEIKSLHRETLKIEWFVSPEQEELLIMPISPRSSNEQLKEIEDYVGIKIRRTNGMQSYFMAEGKP